jgi:hypothetical protein
MVSGQNPSKDTRRQQLRDNCLWSRELQRARLLNLKQLHCPCRKCKGQRRLQLQTVRDHLVQNGRDSEFRVWRGPRERHSSDEEWEEEFWRPEQQPQETLDAHIDTRGMIHNTFEERDEPDPGYSRVQEVVADAFTMADNIHDECRSAYNWNELCFDNIVEDDVPDNVDDAEEDDNVQFDSDGLEEALGGLYEGAKSSTLVATILLLNLCTVHGASNFFVNELFYILHGHILPNGNSLPRNNYAARTLTRKLGLTYNTIHAYESGCVLFRGVLANTTESP